MTDNQNIYSDSELWSSFIAGDKEAFSILYRLSYKKLYSYGISLGMDNDQIRDIIQDLFVKLFEKPELIKETSTIAPFLFVSMRNAFINNQKIKERYPNLNNMETFDVKYITETDTIGNQEDEMHIKQRVDEIMNILSPRQKEIIYLRFLHQMEYEEIASIMNLSEQAARNLTHRAIKKMRDNNLNQTFFILISLLIIYK
ncbi:MAG: sigma-70 family RNA polymerase sigma factor [Candidatus Symbiothrix sp.]|jgi:RNA polymerase sigma factor (sigma-70 family)|nr:sigma-70 family RNA polymerase sigma factor [Candidatus Symbiothrix sp.]